MKISLTDSPDKPDFSPALPGMDFINIHPRSIGQHGRKRRWTYRAPKPPRTPPLFGQGVFEFMQPDNGVLNRGG